MPKLFHTAELKYQRMIEDFVGARLGFASEQGFGPSWAIGVLDLDNDLIGGAVFHNWDTRYGAIEMSVAGTTPRWLTPRIVHALLAYPFVDLKVRKIMTTIDSRNHRSIRLTTGLGFAIEAVLKDHCAPGSDLLITAMWREYWEMRYGQGIKSAAPAKSGATNSGKCRYRAGAAIS